MNSSRFNFVKEYKKEKKRREHINFKIQIDKKMDMEIFTDFLEKDIKKRLRIDKRYYNDNNECHLKHLNFITMEILLHRILTLYQVDFENSTSKSPKDSSSKIHDNMLYVPENSYEKDLTKIKRSDIINKYRLMANKTEIDKIANSIYLKYKDFDFINLNFLKRKIYEFI